MADSPKPIVGVVAIGRNEGARLEACLRSLAGATHVVYVDSGSTDGSVALARSLGVDVLELDASVPFTAARARNAGARRLLDLHSDLSFIQFVDGDCEMAPGWLATAVRALEGRSDVAVVCGRRRERDPSSTVYNLLADMEWDTPVGEARSCGGDALFRARAFLRVRGFREALICGEEPELCVRLRASGWKVLRIDAEMTVHDAAMFRFGQWWRRATRSGWAFAEGVRMHGGPPELHCVRQARSTWFWGLGLPLCALAAALPTRGIALLLLLGYPLLVAKVTRDRRRHGDPLGHAWTYGFFCTLGKFPQVIGQLRHWRNLLGGGQATLIEYKRD